MSTAHEAVTIPMPQPSLSTFERYLTVWVFLCIIIGVALGHWFPRPFEVLGQLKVAEVNLPVAVLIWLMIIPMLLKIDFAALHQVKEHWRGAVSRSSSTGASNPSLWPSWDGFSCTTCLLSGCRPNKSILTSLG
jgi:hypothetical protein